MSTQPFMMIKNKKAKKYSFFFVGAFSCERKQERGSAVLCGMRCHTASFHAVCSHEQVLKEDRMFVSE